MARHRTQTCRRSIALPGSLLSEIIVTRGGNFVYILIKQGQIRPGNSRRGGWSMDHIATGGGDARRPGLISRLVAAIYDRGIARRERQVFGEDRRRLLRGARGRVLDVGAGTGANLPHYSREQVSELVLLDPSLGMLDRARRKATELGLAARILEQGAERLPFSDESFDTIVFTLSLCTIPDPAAALREAHRVLRPSGQLLVLEHVRAHEASLAAWQDRLTPLWKLFSAGCHPNRNTRAAIEAARFSFESVEESRDRRIPVALMQPKLIGVARRAE
ncbi:MAG: class I SAM-dependent methyltransferase [Chloroflexota bacterium]